MPLFLEKIKELIQEQDNEIEKAVINRGKYMINLEFKRFSKTEEEWFTKMKEGDRVRHLQRFSSLKLSSPTNAVTMNEKKLCFSHSGQSSGLHSKHGSSLNKRLDCALSSEHSSTPITRPESFHGPKHPLALSSGCGSSHISQRGSALGSGHTCPQRGSTLSSGYAFPSQHI